MLAAAAPIPGCCGGLFFMPAQWLVPLYAVGRKNASALAPGGKTCYTVPTPMRGGSNAVQAGSEPGGVQARRRGAARNGALRVRGNAWASIPERAPSVIGAKSGAPRMGAQSGWHRRQPVPREGRGCFFISPNAANRGPAHGPQSMERGLYP